MVQTDEPQQRANPVDSPLQIIVEASEARKVLKHHSELEQTPEQRATERPGAACTGLRDAQVDEGLCMTCKHNRVTSGPGAETLMLHVVMCNRQAPMDEMRA